MFVEIFLVYWKSCFNLSAWLMFAFFLLATDFMCMMLIRNIIISLWRYIMVFAFKYLSFWFIFCRLCLFNYYLYWTNFTKKCTYSVLLRHLCQPLSAEYCNKTLLLSMKCVLTRWYCIFVCLLSANFVAMWPKTLEWQWK